MDILHRYRNRFPSSVTKDGRPLGIRCDLVSRGKVDLSEFEPEFDIIDDSRVGTTPFFYKLDHTLWLPLVNRRTDKRFVRRRYLNPANELAKLLKMSTITRRRLPYMSKDKLSIDVVESIRSNAFPNTTKILADKIRVVLAALDTGLPVSKACVLAGITKAVYNSWIEKAIEGEAPYTDILELFTMAQHNFEQKLLNAIEKSGTVGHDTKETVEGVDSLGRSYSSTKVKTSVPSWQASAWILERLYKDTYSQNASNNELEEIENRKRLENDIAGIELMSAPADPSATPT